MGTQVGMGRSLRVGRNSSLSCCCMSEVTRAGTPHIRLTTDSPDPSGVGAELRSALYLDREAANGVSDAHAWVAIE